MNRLYRVALVSVLLSWVGLSFFGLCTITDLRFDDPLHLQRDPRMTMAWEPALKAIWTENHVAYWPVTTTAWYVLRKVSLAWGSFQPLYVASWGLHLAATLLTFLILAQLFASPVAAFWGALFFGIHPLHVEPVAWLTGLRDVLSGALALLSLLLYVRWAKRGKVWRLLLSWGVFALSLLAKPNIAFFWLAFPFVVLNWKRLREQRLSLLLWGLLLPIVLFQMPSNSATTDWLLDKTSISARVLVALDAVSFYAAKILFPLQTAFDYGRTPARVLGNPEMFVTALLPFVVLYFLRRMKSTAFGVIFLLALLPSLGLVPFIHQHISTVADRYAYCAVLVLAFAVARLVATSPRWQWATLGVAVAFTLLTLAQVGLWMNPESLYRHMVEVNPKSWLGHNSLAAIHASRAETDRAVAELRLGILGQDEVRKKPEMLNFLGSYLIGNGRYFEAIRVLQEAVELRPSFAKAHHNLGMAWMKLGAAEHAEDEFWIALTWDPKLKESREGLREASGSRTANP